MLLSRGLGATAGKSDAGVKDAGSGAHDVGCSVEI